MQQEIVYNSSDNSAFNESGLGRCEQNQSKEKLVTSMKATLKEEIHKIYQASCRLNILSTSSLYLRARLIFAQHKCAKIKSARI